MGCQGWIRSEEWVGYNQLPPHWIMGRDPSRLDPLKCTSDTSGKTGFLSFLIYHPRNSARPFDNVAEILGEC